MPASEERILAFVRSSIKSAWSLELLLLLQREPQRRWSVAALVQELRGSVAVVTESLNSLSSANLVLTSEKGGHRYCPGSQELDDIVTALSELNARKPLLILEAIFTLPNEKIRSFSDAFLIKRNER